ncbi:MAG TPA: BatD family protein [Steroidobacteraceae bacterium]|nr:BatD family protein [Steroidobacteraceae bacterium]
MRAWTRRLLPLLLGCGAAAQALAGVTASLNASRVASGDTVQLTLEHDGRTSGQPDLSPLQRDFDILATDSSTTFELMNGSASEKTQVVLTLAPKVTGSLTIPALSWDGEQSRPLSLTVTGPGGAGQPGGSGAAPTARVFIETTTSPARPYVQAAFHLTVRLFTSETLYHANLELPENGDVLVRQVGSDQQGSTERDGRNYQVVTRQYLLFALHSGKLTLQGPVLNAEVAAGQGQSSFANNPFGGFFGAFRTVRPLRVQGNPLVLSVRPRPAGAVGSYWLPARNVTLSAAWRPAQLTARAGDPMTLDLDLQATGLTAAQLPDLSQLLNFPSGLRAYPDQPKLEDSSQNGGLVGSRDQTIALIADSPGHYTIPALTVTWWDTQNNQPRTATLPARTLTILPAAGSSAPVSTASTSSASTGSAPGNVASTATPASATRKSPAPAASARHPTSAQSPSEWEWISIGFAIAWLATLGAWLWSRRSRPVPPAPGADNLSGRSRPVTLAVAGGRARGPRDPAAAPVSSTRPLVPTRERAAFRTACEANDAPAARAHLLAWAAGRWGTVPGGIGAIAATIGDPNVAALLRDLDRACYAGGAWQGGPLAAALTDLPAPTAKSSRADHTLAPLYPDSADPPASIRRRRT